MLTRLIAALVVVTSAQLAQAQDPEPRPRVIEIDPIDVVGRRQAPAAFYVLHRSELGYQVTDLRESFVRRIIESVRRAPL